METIVYIPTLAANGEADFYLPKAHIVITSDKICRGKKMKYLEKRGTTMEMEGEWEKI
jgi:hypothetical protein